MGLQLPCTTLGTSRPFKTGHQAAAGASSRSPTTARDRSLQARQTLARNAASAQAGREGARPSCSAKCGLDSNGRARPGHPGSTNPQRWAAYQRPGPWSELAALGTPCSSPAAQSPSERRASRPAPPAQPCSHAHARRGSARGSLRGSRWQGALDSGHAGALRHRLHGPKVATTRARAARTSAVPGSAREEDD